MVDVSSGSPATQLVSQQIAGEAYAITKSNSAVNAYSYIYVGGAGSVAVVTAGGNTVTFAGVPAGGYIWVRTSKVLSTGTDATDMVGFR